MKETSTEEEKEIDYEKVREFFSRSSQRIIDRAQISMWIAEANLVESLNPEQKKLYDIYKEEKEDFFLTASIFYEKIL